MTNSEKILIIKLLDMAAQEFSNHGCNDFKLSHWIPDLQERRNLIKAYHKHNGTPEEFDPNSNYEYFPDFALMLFMASKLDEEID
jgi:hypothetical protein